MLLVVPSVRVSPIRVPHLGDEIRNRENHVGFEKSGAKERS
jgi:hypothetical protein